MRQYAAAVAALVQRLPAERVHTVADQIGQDWPTDAVAWNAAGEASLVQAVLAAQRSAGLTAAAAAAYLRGAADGYQRGVQRQQVELVVSGPASAAAPVRATAAVLVDLIAAANRELLLVTYSARPYPPVIAALQAALLRGVGVDIVVETLAGAGSALSGTEPAAAFAGLSGIRLWHWPADTRPSPGAKMHAKLAVADRQILFVSSVNLTQSGVEHSLETGVVIHGGTGPDRAVDHFRRLFASQILRPLSLR
ncbi:MAG: DISARM system phospholipase D-like protein DrmC [Micromonosporaceae bacterium]|nr:DISARM system phospholipase D-like protein DrmC [Micromonosporaceae bacterium]